MKFLQELMDMGAMDDKPEKHYKYQEEAREHAKTFVSDAKNILNHNSREGTNEEVEKLAMQAAKDYHQSICKAIQRELGQDDNEVNNFDDNTYNDEEY